jgi:iron complex outermembrane receptor protein
MGSVNKTLRLPTFTDLYYSGPANQGNPDLKPEEAIATELGLCYLSGAYHGYITVFKRYGRNLIDWVKMPGESKWTTMNYTKVDASGLEFSISWRQQNPNEKYFIQSISANYTFMNLSKQNTDYESYYVMDYLKNKAGLHLNHTIFKQLSASWYFTWLYRNGTFTQYPTGKETPYKDFLIADIRVNYRLKSFNIYLEASNLFNTPHYDLGNVSLPGRWLKAGVNIQFNLQRKKSEQIV